MKTLIGLILTLSFSFAHGKVVALERLESVQSWSEFETWIEKKSSHEKKTGQAYMISGALLVLGGIVGYHNSQSSVEKLAYSVSQSLGVAGIGYGASLFYVGSEDQNFHDTVGGAKSLSEQNRNELVKEYVATQRMNQANDKLIRIVSHSIVAAMNLYNASREEQEDLRQGLYVLGGVNVLAAISLSF